MNQTKGEKVSFYHLPVNSRREICGHPVAAAIVAWYLSSNQGDSIQFVTDSLEDWPFQSGSRADLSVFSEKTGEVVEALIREGILADEGMEWVDEDEPNRVYIRAIKNVWLKNGNT